MNKDASEISSCFYLALSGRVNEDNRFFSGLAGAGCSGEEFGPGGEVDSVNVLKVIKNMSKFAN